MKSKQHLSTLKAKMNVKRSFFDKVADEVSAFFGSMAFFVLHVLFFGAWVLMNLNMIPGIEPFDPYPFSFLTMLVSLEAIFLSIFVLISQNRAAEIADLREEVTLQLDAKSENEVTKILNMLDEIHDKLGLNPVDDPELKRMKKKTDLDAMERKLLKEIKGSSRS